MKKRSDANLTPEWMTDAAEDAELRTPDPQELQNIAKLAAKLRESEDVVSRLEGELKEAKERSRIISERELPDAMTALGLKSFQLSDGGSVTIKDDLAVHVKKALEPKVFAWLRKAGHGDIIKRTLTMAFGKGEDTKADSIKSQVIKAGANVVDKAAIHAQTLKAWTKEQRAEGKPLPPGLDVHEIKLAKITRPKIVE